MKIFVLFLSILLIARTANGQQKKTVDKQMLTLPDLKKCVAEAQVNAVLYSDNFKDNSKEHDANSIILDIEKYIDSMHGARGYADQLLIKYFNPLRHFFLTTTNKTSVATMFLYDDAPYHFCLYNDTAVTLYIGAIKDGNTYNLSKMTENKIARTSFENCLLPALKALDEFKDSEPKYIGLSVY